jgi:hypothetical protein
MTAGPFLRAVIAGTRTLPKPRFVFLCIADHFEPDWGGAAWEQQAARVQRWITQYEPATSGLQDSAGRGPQHTFFYPIEVYSERLVESLAGLVNRGCGDIEVHLHHDDDNSESLRELLETSVQQMHQRHGLFKRDREGQLRYGFIHGNWALDNSHPDGHWCGVNNEIDVLIETGCYADFTMPAAPHAAQTSTINSIYYAVDDPQKPKSHDRGTPARRGEIRPDKSLLLIQGPLAVAQDRPWRKPKIENGNISASQPLDPSRIENWIRANVHVQGHPEWVFVKLHTHGAPEKNADSLLGPMMRDFHQGLRRISEVHDFRYYYVTAREMAQLVRQAEAGLESPNFDDLGW